MSANTSEHRLERLIRTAMDGYRCNVELSQVGPPGEAAHPSGEDGWICERPGSFDREHTINQAELSAFLEVTQPDAFERLGLTDHSPTSRRLLARLHMLRPFRAMLTQPGGKAPTAAPPYREGGPSKRC